MKNFEEISLSRITSLNKEKKILFCYLCSYRIIDNFLLYTNSNEVNVITNKIYDNIKDFVVGENLKDDIRKLLEDFYKFIPDTNDFYDINTEYTLNASAALYTTLDYILNPDDMELSSVPILVRDSLDFYIQEKLSLKPNDPLLEIKINQSLLMINEFRIQEELFLKILKMKDITRGDIYDLEKDSGKLSLIE